MPLDTWWRRYAQADPRMIGAVILFALGGVVITYVLAVVTLPGQWVDGLVFGRVQRLALGPLNDVVPWMARVALPALLVGLTAALWLFALVRGWWREALVVAVTVPTTAGAAWVLRVDVLPRPDRGGYGYATNTLPSTHVALVTALVVSSLVLWPWVHPAWMGWCAAGLVAAAALGNVVGHAHLPSDVLAAALLAVADFSVWYAVFRPDLSRPRAPTPWRAPRGSGPT